MTHSVFHNSVENEGTERATTILVGNIFARLKVLQPTLLWIMLRRILDVQRQQPAKNNAYAFHIPTTSESRRSCRICTQLR
jgi:hypothetical protein